MNAPRVRKVFRAVKKAAPRVARTVFKTGFNSMVDVVKKEAEIMEAQKLVNDLGMPQLVSLIKGVALTKAARPGKVLPVFAGANRKTVIPTVANGTVSTSTYAYKYNDKAIPKKTGDINQVVRKNTLYGNITSPINQQSRADIPLLSCSEISSGGSNYTSCTYQALFNTAFNVGGASPTIPLSPSARDQNRVILDRFESTTTVVNPGDAPVEVTIYDLQPKRDLPVATYSSTMYASGLQSPSNTWDTGISNAVDVEDTTTSSVIGTVPTSVLKFNTFWKVMKRTKVEMTAGSTHIHRCASIFNVVFNYYDWSEVLGCRAMLCPTQLIVWKGMPTSGDLAASATINVATNCELHGRGAVNDNITVRSYNSSTT